MDDHYQILEQDYDENEQQYYIIYRYFNEEIADYDESIKYFDNQAEMEEYSEYLLKVVNNNINENEEEGLGEEPVFSEDYDEEGEEFDDFDEDDDF